MKQILLSLRRQIDKSTNLKNLDYPSICTCIYINIDIDVHIDISTSSPLTHGSFLLYLLACFQPPTSTGRHLGLMSTTHYLNIQFQKIYKAVSELINKPLWRITLATIVQGFCTVYFGFSLINSTYLVDHIFPHTFR